MIRTSGVFGTLGALAGATLLTLSLMGGMPAMGAAAIGIIVGGAAGGIAGGVLDKVVGALTPGAYHHNPDVRKLQRESMRDGREDTNLNRREAENRFRQIQNDQAKEEAEREWQQRIEEERAATEARVYSSGSGRGGGG